MRSGSIWFTLLRASFHISIFMAWKALPVLSKSAETMVCRILSSMRGPIPFAWTCNSRRSAMYAFLSNARRPRRASMSLTFFDNLSSSYSSVSSLFLSFLSWSASFFFLTSFTDFVLSFFLPEVSSLSFCSLSSFLFFFSSVISHRSIIFSRRLSSSSSSSSLESSPLLQDADCPSELELESEPDELPDELESESESLSEPLELSEPEPELEELPEPELEESPDDPSCSLLESLPESSSSSSSEPSPESKSAGFSMHSLTTSWYSLLPLRTLARRVLNALALFSGIGFSPWAFFSWTSLCFFSRKSSRAAMALMKKFGGLPSASSWTFIALSLPSILNNSS
mmetsp:Transcript_19323/g.36148  ORF Transcript_19323/g.36148 Transcript_19323/m.36148 type:complete len:341 (-) Transcript_19323:391-1413(-)